MHTNERIKAYDALIDRFFKTLKSLQFAQSEAVLAEMRTKISEHHSYYPWLVYLAGVLEQEKNRDWAKAERIFEQVLTMSPSDELRADIYLSLGIAYENQARWHDAIAIATKGVELRDKLNQPIRKTMLLRQIAIACYRGFEAGDLKSDMLDVARAKCEEAIWILETFPSDSDHGSIYEFDRLMYSAITNQVLGAVYTCMGHYKFAHDKYRRFLEISLERKDQFHIGCASWYMADVLQLSQHFHWETALSLYDDALAIFRQKKEIFFQFHLLASKGALYYRHGVALQAIPCFQQSIELLEQVRSGISAEEARSGFFSTVVNIHDNAIVAKVAAGQLSSAFDNAEMARSRTVFDRLMSSRSTITRQGTPALSAADVQQLLPPESLLLEFHCTGLLKTYGGQTTEQQAMHNVLYPDPQTLVFCLTETAIDQYNLDISPNMLSVGDNQSVEQNFSSSVIRRALYTKLIAPIAHHLKGKRRLYIIPHGPLHYVPFHALIAPDGDTLLREDGPEIVYAPSATILFRELQKHDSLPPGTCLAVGYNGDAGMELHFAEEEATYIARMAGGSALVGPSAKKTALYAQAPNYRALHFSCHGEFDPDSPLESLLHIGPGETLTGQQIMDNLQLNCNLVTLSACESGLSKVQRGDELYGLIRAFMYAGAPAIIATLWRVDERSTLIFAEKFYELAQQGVSYATALKVAQLYLKNLTRKEALAILTRHIAQTAPATGDPLLLQAQQYLKGFGLREALQNDESTDNDLLPGTDDDEKIFADPKFWAPFVLIGDPQIQRP